MAHVHFLKRFGVYTVIAACFIYFFYTLSFSDRPRDNIPANDGKHAEYHQSSELQPEKPETPGWLTHHEEPPKEDAQTEPSHGLKPLEATHEWESVKEGAHKDEQVFFSWGTVTKKYPVDSMVALPTGEPMTLPRIQHDFLDADEDATAKNIRETRQADVKEQFLKCWTNYRKRAWMQDELQPISGGSSNSFGGWAATLIDAMDTLWIMGFKDEFNSAIPDIEKINFGNTTLDTINLFETNIRYLGGLLSAYELSEEKRLLAKAKEVGEMLYHAFDTPNHMPVVRWNMRAAVAGSTQVASNNMLLAELASFSMEFTRLSQLTDDPKWYDAISRITDLLEEQQMRTKLPGMWPIVVDGEHMDLTQDSQFTLASMSDSAYEYLPKTYALLGGLEPVYKSLYEKAASTAIKHTLYRPMTPEDADILATGSVHSVNGRVTLDPELQHLSCYTGGMFALGGKLFDQTSHVSIGRKLTDTCIWAYKAGPAGIMPEVSHLLKCPNATHCQWDERLYNHAILKDAAKDGEIDPLQGLPTQRLPKGFTSMQDRRYILRPEAIESVFILYRITGEQRWQAAAWDMWTSIQSATDTEFGNAAVMDVSTPSPSKQDSMESFWMAETLKYFYLIFSTPDTISLDDYVFNTEAHPLRISKPSV